MSENRNPHDAVDYILLNGKKFAQAKAERVYLEEYRKSLLNGEVPMQPGATEASGPSEFKETDEESGLGVDLSSRERPVAVESKPTMAETKITVPATVPLAR